MEGRLDGGVVRVGGDARQRYYDSSGYGRPTGEEVALAPVEAAHLLFRGDLDTVDGMGFREFLAIDDRLVVRFQSIEISASAGSTSRPRVKAGSTPATSRATLPTTTIPTTPWDSI